VKNKTNISTINYSIYQKNNSKQSAITLVSFFDGVILQVSIPSFGIVSLTVFVPILDSRNKKKL